MAHTFHQLAQSRTRLGAQVVPGVAQVVEVDHRQPGGFERSEPDATAEVAMPQRHASGTCEHERFVAGSGESGQVPGQVLGDQVGERDDALTRVGLRRPEVIAAARHLGKRPLNPDCADSRSMSLRRSAASSPQRRLVNTANRISAR